MTEDAYIAPDPAIVPYLSVSRGKDAIDWYGRAFGAVAGERYDMDDGRVGHVALTLENRAVIYLADDFPEMADTVGVRPPETWGGSSVSLALAVDDVDRWIGRAAAAGAVVIRPATDQFYGRNGKVRDPFGHVWSVTGPLKGG